VDCTGHATAGIRSSDPSREMLAHRPWADEDEVAVPRQRVGDGPDEPAEMLEPLRLASGLRRSAAAMSNRWVVPDMTRRAVMRRDIRHDAGDPRHADDPTNDDRPAGVDPHERGRRS
jgi:hypothetical protein